MNLYRSPAHPSHARTSVWSFDDDSETQIFLDTNHYSHEKKTLKLSDLVRKWSNIDLEHFLIHRPHFLADSDEWGLNPRLLEHNNSFATISTRVWCQKTVSIEWFDTEDRARELISGVTGGTLWTKVGPKTTLEGRITTRNGRVARGRCRRSI